MYLLPAEIFLSLYLLIPMALVAFRWQHSIGWGTLTMACAVSSWIFFNALMIISPPDHGLARLVYFVTGWFWMLPILFLLLCMEFIIRWIWVKLDLPSLRERFGEVFLKGISSVSTLILLWGLVGQMSRERALVEARRELSGLGYQTVGPADAVFSKGHWIIRYPETDFKEICLHRDGRMAWIGSP